MHILSTFLFYRSLESVGVDMPWIETMNLLNISTLFAFKSSWSLVRIRRRSAWILISTQFRNGNVAKWLKYAKHSCPIMKSSLGKYVLQDSTNWLVPSTSSTNICNTSFASSIDNVGFPSFAKHLCWYRKTLLLTLSLSHMKSKRSVWEQDLADLSWVIKDSKASIPGSTNIFLSWKSDFNAGLIFSNFSCCFTEFSVSLKTSKLDLSKASTVWLLHGKCKGMWDEYKALATVSSFSRFFCYSISHNSINFLLCFWLKSLIMRYLNVAVSLPNVLTKRSFICSLSSKAKSIGCSLYSILSENFRMRDGHSPSIELLPMVSKWTIDLTSVLLLKSANVVSLSISEACSCLNSVILLTDGTTYEWLSYI